MIDDRKITFIFSNGTEESYEVGKESSYGLIEGIWVSHEPKDFFARIMTKTHTISFKGVPFFIEEARK